MAGCIEVTGEDVHVHGTATQEDCTGQKDCWEHRRWECGVCGVGVVGGGWGGLWMATTDSRGL